MTRQEFSRQERIKLFGLEIVEDDESYWLNLGYKIDYENDRLVKIIKEEK